MKTHGSRILLTSTLLAMAGLVACAPPNAPLRNPPEKAPQAEQQAKIEAQVEYAPKVDVLFVIDTSESMKPHIESLTQNIGEFVRGFGVQSGNLDYQIGVVSVYDSKRYGTTVQKFYPLGQLRPLNDPARPGEAIAGPQFVSRSTEHPSEILQASLNLTIEPREKCEYDSVSKRPVCTDLGGPEFEELFTPVMAAVSPAVNPGFSRADAHLAVIMITDANDDSMMTASQLNGFLRKLKGGSQMYSTYSVLAIPYRAIESGKSVAKECKRDPSGEPKKILEFAKLSKGEVYSLCQGFGSFLADLGGKIQKKASSRVVVALETEPAIDSIKVKMGDVEIPPGQTGWEYDADSISLLIDASVARNQAGADAKISIEYVPVDAKKRLKGRVVSLGN